MSISPISSSVKDCNVEDHFNFLRALSPYNELCRFNAYSNKPELLLIGERHSKKETIAPLVNQLASQGPVLLLVEEYESGYVLSEEEMEAHLVGYGIQNVDNIHIVGWNVSDRIRARIGYPLHYRLGLQKSVDQLSLQIPQFEQFRVNDRESLDKIFSCDVAIESLNENEMLTAARCVQRIHLLDDLIPKMKEGMDVLNELLIDARNNPASKERVALGFPSTTNAMISTLQKLETIKEQLGINEASTLLVAGSSHLKKLEMDYDNPQFDLADLYHELEDHNATILIAKKAHYNRQDDEPSTSSE